MKKWNSLHGQTVVFDYTAVLKIITMAKRKAHLELGTRNPYELKEFIEQNFKFLFEPVKIEVDPHWIENDGSHYRIYITVSKHLNNPASVIFTLGEWWGKEKEKKGIYD